MAAATVRSLPFCAVYERNKIFAFDLIFSLAQEYRTDWTPYGWPYYFIDPLSPMTSDILDGMKVLLKNREQYFLQKYEQLVPRGTIAHAGIFYEHARYVFQIFFNRRGTEEEFFHVMVYVGRLGTLFYQRGVLEAANHAIVAISESLAHYMNHYGAGIFPMFCIVGRTLAATSGGTTPVAMPHWI